MSIKLSAYQQLLKERFLHQLDKDTHDTYIGLAIFPKEEGSEEEMFEYLKAHPDADLQELMQHWVGLSGDGPLEIVDDDELDEDERND